MKSSKADIGSPDLLEKVSLCKLLIMFSIVLPILILYATFPPNTYKYFKRFSLTPSNTSPKFKKGAMTPILDTATGIPSRELSNSSGKVWNESFKYLVDTPGCQIIDLNPFDPAIRNFIRAESLPKCGESFVISSDGVSSTYFS